MLTNEVAVNSNNSNTLEPMEWQEIYILTSINPLSKNCHVLIPLVDWYGTAYQITLCGKQIRNNFTAYVKTTSSIFAYSKKV